MKTSGYVFKKINNLQNSFVINHEACDWKVIYETDDMYENIDTIRVKFENFLKYEDENAKF